VRPYEQQGCVAARGLPFGAWCWLLREDVEADASHPDAAAKAEAHSVESNCEYEALMRPWNVALAKR
jgi:hypothetical protein